MPRFLQAADLDRHHHLDTRELKRLPSGQASGRAEDLVTHHRRRVADDGPNVLENVETLCRPCHLAEHRGLKDELRSPAQ